MKSTTGVRRSLAIVGIGILLCFLGSTRLHAQIFQVIYGGPSADAARGDIITIPAGADPLGPGFVAVGNTSSFSPDQDIYFIRTMPFGVIMPPTAIYNIGGDDIARKVQKTADQGYIIVGQTNDSGNCCMYDNIFLLKVDFHGNVQWVKTYGGIDADEGWDVKEERSGGVQPVTLGYYVAGRTASFGNGIQGDRDAFLMRTDAAGNVDWARVYGGPNDDGFFTCELSTVNGAIYAAGGTQSFGGSTNIFVVKASTANGFPMLAAHYGFAGDEGVRQMEELQQSAPAIAGTNDLILAGNITAVPGANSDGLLLRIDANLGFVTAHQVAGNPAGGWDEFMDVKEVRPPLVPAAYSSLWGNLVVTGMFFGIGAGNYDLYTGEFLPGAGLPTVWQNQHGSYDEEHGYGIDVAPENPGFSPGFTVAAAGFTKSFSNPGPPLFFPGFGGPPPPNVNAEDVYLIRARRITGFTGCFDSPIATTDPLPVLPPNYIVPPNSRVRVQCERPIRHMPVGDVIILCQAQGGAVDPGSSSSDGVAPTPTPGNDIGNTSNVLMPALDQSIRSYPNPIKLGHTFIINYMAEAGGTVTISDITGKIVYENPMQKEQGNRNLRVSTEGWAKGTYLIKVSGGTQSVTRQIVITD